MLRNVWSKVTLDRNTNQSTQNQYYRRNDLQPVNKLDPSQDSNPISKISSSSSNRTVNRDSGIFEDFNSLNYNSEEDLKAVDYLTNDTDSGEDSGDYFPTDSESARDYFPNEIDSAAGDYFPTESDSACEYFPNESDSAGDYFPNEVESTAGDYFPNDPDSAGDYFPNESDSVGEYFPNEEELNSEDELEDFSDEELSRDYDSDRVLHGSVSSLNSSAASSSSLSISLSSISSSEDEHEGIENLDLSDLDLSSIDSSDSSSSDSDEEDYCSEDENEQSKSFGYHSLLNDEELSANEEDDKDIVNSPVKLEDDDYQVHKEELVENNNNFGPQAVIPQHFLDSVDNLQVYRFNSISPALSFYDNNLSLSEKEKYLTDSEFSSSESLDFEEDNCSSPTSGIENLDEDSPSDIEQKMAETEVKMCDAHLSSGREELLAMTRNRKYQKNMNKLTKEALFSEESLKLKQLRNEFNPMNNNNNFSNYNTKEGENLSSHSSKKKDMKLPLKKKENSQTISGPSWKDNRYSSSLESPIVDAYEKECRDVPEKMVKELESKEKEQVTKTQMDIEHDQDLQAFEAVMKEAIKKKEAGSKSNARIPIDLSDMDLALRHRPSPKQRRKGRNALRRSLPPPQNAPCTSRDSNRAPSPEQGEFDVYTMETALPKLDWEAIENHFKQEEEKRRRTDREEIRKKLAMGADDIEDEAKLTKKPSLHSRLQNGKNLQICFMNETASDCESQCSDTESTQDRIDELEPTKDMNPKDFATHQARLQEEARLALSQAKQMARMQMQLEKQHQIKSPITEIVRGSFHKVGFPCPDSKRRMSRQILTDMNVAQLQIIVNEFHTQIENLNEVLVKLLLRRDDLHMEQDSMLVDIEDLNKHLGAKDGCLLLAQNDKKAKARPTTKSFKLKSFASSK